MKSGFKSVSDFIEDKYFIKSEKVYDDLLSIFSKHGRGMVFDLFLQMEGIPNKNNLITDLVNIYRYENNYTIKLYKGVKTLFDHLYAINTEIAILTDTNWRVQKNKVEALGLNNIVDKVYYSDKMGLKKPALKLYNTILKDFMVKPNQIVWVGDDPTCDFEVPNKIGSITVRIKNGRLKNLSSSLEKDGKYQFKTFAAFNRFIMEK